MNKSVYSLVLSDEVVAAVDRAAYRAGMSRSAFINSVLAEAVRYAAPEKRMNDIFTAVEQLMDGGIFRIMPRPSDSVFAVRSALRYKYKPLIRYSVEMCKSHERQLATFRASLRTQSAALLDDFSAFTALWQHLEATSFKQPPDSSREPGKYSRTFDLTPQQGLQPPSPDTIASALSGYITFFDEVLNIYLANAEHPDIAAKTAEKRYRDHIAGTAAN